ncbi:MAG: hypothetical protein ACP5OG_00660 [Candidatus Nanoarchaeia archaeon]
MEFIQLKNIYAEEFKSAWRIYEEAFPKDERRNLNKIKKYKTKIDNFGGRKRLLLQFWK